MYHALLVQLLRERHALLHPVIIQNRSWQLIELHRLTSVLLRLCSSLALDPLASNTYGPGSIRVRRSVTHNKQEQCLSHKGTKAETPHPTHLRQARARASPRSRPPVRRNVRRELASRPTCLHKDTRITVCTRTGMGVRCASMVRSPMCSMDAGRWNNTS